MSKKNKILLPKFLVEACDYCEELSFDSYKKNLNGWFVLDKKAVFNLETNERECSLKIAPLDVEFKDFLRKTTIEYQVSEELYNKIQIGDEIKVIVEKKEEE